MRRANTCDPALKLINEEKTSDIHKQNLWDEQLDTQWDHMHNTHTHHLVTPRFVDRPRRSESTAGQMDAKVCWWTTSGKIGPPPPTSKG